MKSMTVSWIIICETCNSRLRVRSAAAIGSILACPKCQSLVHVAPPPTIEDKTAVLEGNSSFSDPPETSKIGPARLAVVTACIVGAVALGVVIAVLWQSSDEQIAVAAQTPAGQLHNMPEDPPTRDADEEPVSPAEAADEHLAPERPPEPADSREIGTSSTSAISAQSLPKLPSDSPPIALPDSGATSRSRGQGKIPDVGVPLFDMDLSQITTPSAVPRLPASEASSRRDDLEAPGNESPPRHQAELSRSPDSSIVKMKLERVDLTGGAVVLVDPAQSLSLPLVDLNLDGLSGVQIVRLIGDLTGATITLTPAAYEAARTTPTNYGRLAQITAGEVLLGVLEQQGLRVEQRGSYLVVVPRAEAGGAKLADGWQAALPSASLQSKLDEHLTFSFTEPTHLARVLRHIEQAAELTLLVDWEAAAEQDLTPATLVTTSVVHQPLEEVLDRLLPQIGITWLPVGDDAIWLSTHP
jgi:hypothetical protein